MSGFNIKGEIKSRVKYDPINKELVLCFCTLDIQ